MGQRSNYWSCSKFADWVRGTPKRGALTADGWHEWETEAKGYNPVRYWIAEEALDAIQNFIWWPVDQLYAFKYYINNRFVTRTHSLTAHSRDIKPGQWQDVGNRFLPCLFNELVNFVEIEQAWHHCMWSDEAKTKFKTPWWRKGWLRWRTWRCAEAGMEYLRWASTLTNEEFLDEDEKHLAEPTYQAKAAKEIIELYTWWTVTYRNRPDPMDASGWSDYCEQMRVKYPGSFFTSLNSKDEADREASTQAHNRLSEIEKAYADEDEAMMIRLIKIRESLWT